MLLTSKQRHVLTEKNVFMKRHRHTFFLTFKKSRSLFTLVHSKCFDESIQFTSCEVQYCSLVHFHRNPLYISCANRINLDNEISQHQIRILWQNKLIMLLNTWHSIIDSNLINSLFYVMGFLTTTSLITFMTIQVVTKVQYVTMLCTVSYALNKKKWIYLNVWNNHNINQYVNNHDLP